MSFALVFSGQGTQHPGMLPWLVDDEIVRSTCARLGVPEWRTALADPAWARDNGNAQVLLTGIAIAAWRQLATHVPAPKAVAGYSIGELAAFSAAGAFEAGAALDLASARAWAMDRCATAHPGGLLSVVGIEAESAECRGAAAGLFIAIRNGRDHLVLGGSLENLERAEPRFKALGGRCTRLRIDVASHTPLMQEAAKNFSQVLATFPFETPKVFLLSGATADRVRSPSQAREALSAQIGSTVRWDECLEAIHARQVRCLIEIGSGQALSRLWSARWPHVPARSGDDFRSLQAVADWISAHAQS